MAKDENVPFHRWYNWLEDRLYEHTGIEKIGLANELSEVDKDDFFTS